MLKQMQTEEAPMSYTPPTVTQEATTNNAQTVDKQTELAVAEFLQQMKQRAKRGRRTLNTALLLLAISVSPLLTTIPFDSDAYRVVAILFLLAGMSVTVAYTIGCLCFAGKRGVLEDIERLEQVCGVKAIGPLLEMRHTFLTQPQQKAIYDALIRLLPQMKASDANTLTRQQYDSLYAVLKSDNFNLAPSACRTDFRLAILKALEQVGDERAIPTVQRLATVPAFLRDARRIREAAQHCLPLLQSNLGKVEATKTLLRASQPAPGLPDTLLRPASPIPETAPHQLLRASNSNAPEPPAL